MANDVFVFDTPPFAAESSVKFLYLDAPRRRILADLIAHVCDGEGAILLVAEAGMGKTMLLERLADEANSHNIRVVSSLADVAAIVAATTADLQPPTAFLLDDGDALPLGLWHQLIGLLRSGAPASPDGFQKRLPPIIIALTPDLLDWLIEASLVPRSTPLDHVFRLPPYAPRDVGRYIALRLRVAGDNRPAVFSNESVERIALVTHGVPGSINRICEAALAEATQRGRSDISLDIVEAAAAVIDAEMPQLSIAPPTALPPLVQPEPSAEPPVPPICSQLTSSIGIVGSGYAPVAGAEAVRRRVRRRRIPRWGGVAIAIGVAGVGAMAMLGYVATPNAPRPSIAPAATTGDAAVAALQPRPLLPPVEPSPGSTGPVPILAQPEARDDRSVDLQRDVTPDSTEATRFESRNETPSQPVVDAAPPPVASTAPVQTPPAPGHELAVTARPAPAGKPGRGVATTERPQSRVGHPRSSDSIEARHPQPAEEPAADGETVSTPDAGGTGEGQPRPVKEIIAMGDEFRDAGDTEWARKLYRAAHERGSAKAAVAEAETYDPQYAAASSRPDPDEARRLYSEAARQGDRQAAKRLEELEQWMSERSSR